MSAVSPDCEMKRATLPLGERRRAIAELGRDVDLHRHPRGLLDPVAGGEACVIGGAAGDDGHPFGVLQREGEGGERHRLRAGVVVGPQRVADGARLLEDLLQHVVAVVALADHGAVVGGDALCPRDRPAARLAYRHSTGPQHRPVALVEVADPLGEGRERQRVRGEIGGVVRVPDGKRRAAPSPDQEPRVACEDDREREGTFELLERFGRGRLGIQPARHVKVDQVRDHLGIGVGAELPPLRLQRGPQLPVVLDDAVVDHRDATGSMRMGVSLAGLAMGRPAGVPDAHGAADRALGHQALKLAELALGPAQLDGAVGERGQPRRIVAPVFEPPQPVEDAWRRLVRAGDADDSAHSSVSPLPSPPSLRPGRVRAGPACAPPRPRAGAARPWRRRWRPPPRPR